MLNQSWHGVPEEHSSAWRKLFNSAPFSEGANLSAPCPVCGASELHRYYALQKVQPRELRGLMYKGPGSYWEWCSACHSFEHMSGYVPDWWTFEPLRIDHSILTVFPDLIDEAMRLQK